MMAHLKLFGHKRNVVFVSSSDFPKLYSTSILSNKQIKLCLFAFYCCLFLFDLTAASPRKTDSSSQQHKSDAYSSSGVDADATTTTTLIGAQNLHGSNGTKGANCPPSFFRCNDGSCIPKHLKCDNKTDCPDRSDEPLECFHLKTCNADEFKCKISENCILKDWVCDGDFDCSGDDRSDEDPKQCNSTTKCLLNESECEGNVCIATEKFCDGKYDCINDESPIYCKSNSTKCTELNCSYNCKLTPSGPKCYCAAGQEPVNETQCQDFDECQVEGICDQVCKNTQNSYFCSCVAGYTKEGDKCHAINVPINEPASLIFLTQDTIQRVSLDGEVLGENNSTLQVKHSTALEVSHRNRSVCFINHMPETYKLGFTCNKLDNLSISWTMPETEVLLQFGEIIEIKLDWISGNWYFLENSRIFVCSAEMKHCTTLIETFDDTPKALALDPTKGFMFLAKETVIDRHQLDAANRLTLIKKKIIYLVAITLDLANEQLYWVDNYVDFIERIDYDGGNRWTMKKSPENNFMKTLHSIALFEDKIFIASWLNRRQNHSILSITTDKRDTVTKRIVKKIIKPDNLLIFHRQRQPEVAHPCRVNNGGCDHLCMPAWRNNIAIVSCICSAGYQLNDRNKCVLEAEDRFLLFSKTNPVMIKGISLAATNDKPVSNVIVPVLNISSPVYFDYNAREQLILFTQNIDNYFERSFLLSSQRFDGSDRKFLIKLNGFGYCAAFDWIGQNFFWLSQSGIGVVSLKNVTQQRILISTMRNSTSSPYVQLIKSFAIDPAQGMLYWSRFSKLAYDAVIEYSWMDGTHGGVLYTNKNEMMWPYCLTIDYAARKLYWADSQMQSIERIGLDGKNHEIIIKSSDSDKQFSISSMTVHGDVLYISQGIGNITKINIGPSLSADKVLPLKFYSKQMEPMAMYPKRFVDNLLVVDKSMQSSEKKCKECPGISLPTPHECACLCKSGYKLNGNGQSCIIQPALINTTPHTCELDSFKCKSFPQCVNIKQVCDGETNCADGSDESAADDGPCHTTCGTHGIENGFRCDGNHCLKKSSVCDGLLDCSDGSDENVENCHEVTCPATKFQCKNKKQCIDRTFVCDKHYDCADFSDEMENCSECAEFLCNNKNCIPTSQLCDGENNCGDNSDEFQCAHECRSDETFCHPKGCINLSHNCDGITDCFDASDEADCDAVSYPEKSDNTKISIGVECSATEFKCLNEIECVPLTVKCDGYADCFDKSDELNCTKITKRPPINQTDSCFYPDRLCRSTGHCVRVDELCDGISHCDNPPDEGLFCDEKVCDHNSDCSHFCHNAPDGFVCSCPLHLYLRPNGLECSTEHACEHWGTCSQVCQTVGKGYKCSCHDGYTLQFDHFTCKSDAVDSPHVIYSNRQDIRGVELKTLAVKNFYSSLRNTIAIDFLYTNDSVQIFWTDVIDDKIYRGTLIGDALRNVEAVVQSGLSTAEGLAVDWIGLNLYWVDSNLDQIEVARINGSYRRTLVAGEMASPRAIALDPRDGLLFWTDWDRYDPRIERCSMAGENRITVIQVGQVNGAWPNGLTIDYQLKRIYWIDARSDSIHTTNYDGADHHLVIRDQETLSHPFSISLFENHVYWTDWRTNSVIRANKWNGSDVSVLQRTLTQPFGIQILHSSRQPRDTIDPCESMNGGCSHLCLLSTNKTYKCECPHVMRLDVDAKTCISIEQVLLFIMGIEIRGVDVVQPNHHTIPTISHSTQVLGPNVIDFMISEGRLYWSDLALNEVKMAGLSNGIISTILDTDLMNLSGFAIDWISKNMYVSTESDGNVRILACNLRGEFVTEIHRDLFNILSITLDPVRGRMYWSHKNEVNQTFLIEVSSLDGSNRFAIIKTEYSAESLTIDFSENRLYFVYSDSGSILYLDLNLIGPDNKPHSIVLKEVLIPGKGFLVSSVTVYKNDLYFADSSDSTIRKCDKENCVTNTILRNTTTYVRALKMYYPAAQTGTNGCSRKDAKCQHLCFGLSEKRFVCKCSIGYVVDAVDPRKCIGESEFLLYSLGHELKGISLSEATAVNQTKALGPISRISLASNIDFHVKSDLIFWADNEKGTITSIKRDGTERHTLLNQFDLLESSQSDWLGGIAVDWVAENIYWSDEKRNLIEVSRFNGSFRYVVISNVDKPKTIAVDPIAGLLFYVGDKKIGRTGLDGSLPFILANQTAQITNLVLDINNQVVYWCESTTDVIMQVDYDGNSKKIMLNHSLENPLAIAIYNNYIYWADNAHDAGSIKRAPKNNLSDFVVVRNNEGNSLKDLKIFSPLIQNGTNVCAVRNGGCEELCLFNGTYPVCACSHGVIGADGKTCQAYDTFLIYSRVQSIESVHMTDHLNMNGPIEKITHPTLLKNTIGLSYDYRRSRIFYSDIHWSSINFVYFNGTNHTTIVTKQISVEGLAYEPISDHLFWTSNSNASIRSIDLSAIGGSAAAANNTLMVKSIVELSPNDKPRGIAVEPCLAMVYWTNWNSQAASIQRAYITGYGKESIITTDIRMPNAITLDYEDHKLYWADARLDKIERTDYDGGHRVVLTHSTPKHPFAMAVYGDLLFWTDWVLKAVLRANKYSGADVVWLRKDIAKPMGIAAIQNMTKDCSASPCQVLNGGCEDVCTLVAGKIKCECTQGKLAADGRLCLPNDKCPNANQFKCKSNECIPLALTCDHINHCMDGSDEELVYCNERACPNEFFMCGNRRCIPLNQTCDGIEHCGDGSDESICNCTADQFRCKSGQCIKLKYRCDREVDCHDVSDEIDCPNRTCSDLPGHPFLCEHTTYCMLESHRCDGENDCWDGSDEVNCPPTTCTPSQFKCSSGECIDMKWRCDREPDCADGGSDELDCYYKTASPTELNVCTAEQFTCKTGTCIDKQFQCDNIPDCSDGSDEDCDYSDHSGFYCEMAKQFIPNSWVCDGDFDCHEGHEDERDCDSRVRTGDDEEKCPDHMFSCRSIRNGCIDFRFFCDGNVDCADNSDEYDGCKNSTFVQASCADTTRQFKCDNGRCIDQDQICNLKDDCGDQSDEHKKLCRNSTRLCAEPLFYRCENGACVAQDKLCNGENDCGDFSDEQTCNVNECVDNMKTQLCEHNCVDKSVGYECTCYKGFRLNPNDRHLCKDVDECLKHPCSQICTNTYGNYQCSCIEGYELKDRHTCKSISTENVKFIFSNRYYIRAVDLHGHETLLTHNLSNAVALDYDWDSKCYYWSDVTSTISKIKKYCPSLGNHSIEIHHTILKNPDGLAVDWVGKNLYWCDKGLDTIEVSKLDGKYRRVLLKDNLQEPRAIAVDPFKKYIYWSDWGDKPHIGKAGMDGSLPKTIIEDDLGWPNALTISFETNELYYGDAREDFIAVSDLNGQNRRIIISRQINPAVNLHHIFALAVWEDRVYWTDWETKSIESCHKDSGDNCTRLLATIHRPMDIRVFHPYRQQQPDQNPCRTAKCSTLCLLSPETISGYRCACPDNFILANDSVSCIANCSSAHFQCVTTYKCIPFYWHCDKQDDCGDGSDEPVNCPNFGCQPGQFQCTNTKCINPNFICDGIDQCGDKSDEAFCDTFACFDTQFKCAASANQSAYCIDDVKRCNGKEDCPGGEDERDCRPKSCPAHKFQCDSGKCIPRVWLCDGDRDCVEDESDERNCTVTVCQNKEFRCKSGRCIPLSWLCDGEEDCPGSEDEKEQCDPRLVEKACEPTEFRCNSGRCIPGRWHCDYEMDCTDGSDELNCTFRNCSESEFRCASGHCIRGNLRCDGDANCKDSSDEIGCNVTCKADEFKCPKNNICIKNHFKCDGDNDCADGADEINCTCPHDHFQCANGRCIMNQWRCDGWNDCIDGSDETAELCTTMSCALHASRCQNRRCVPRSAICDGRDDCGDKSDETNCAAHHRCNYDQFQCERDLFCISAQFRCNGDSNCVDDSDEIGCKTPTCGFGTCSQICLEKKAGYYNCRCAGGYRKGPEKNDTCVAELEYEQTLLIASDSEIRFVVPQKSGGSVIYGFKSLVPDLKIDAFDVFFADEMLMLFWIDVRNRHIQKYQMKLFTLKEKKRSVRNAEDVEVIVQKPYSPKSVAVEWISQRLYFIDSEKRQIISTSLDGKDFVNIVSIGQHPLDIVVEPIARIVVWSTMDEGILSASLDGSNKQALVQLGVEWATGLAFDYPAQRLYWADHRKRTVETCLYNGKDRHVIKRFENATMSPYKIDIFEDSVYVTLYDQSIHKLHKHGHGNERNETLVLGSFHHVSDILLFHPFKQNKNISNPCLQQPCLAGFVCLLTADTNVLSGRVCVCPNGLVETTTESGKTIICQKKPTVCELKCNVGQCVLESDGVTQKCVCPVEYDGKYCEYYRCSGHCRNSGVCSVDPNYGAIGDNLPLPPLRCRCSSLWTGDRCEIPVSTCKELCHNGATCVVNGSNVESCICPTNFNGRHCEICDDLTCENNGVCKKQPNGVSYCDCASGYEGRMCENSICSGYCNGNGKCLIRLGSPQCTCNVGYWGKQCQSNSCAEYCDNGGICTNDNGTKSCECTAEFRGPRCQFCVNSNCGVQPAADNRLCDVVLCQNGGRCQVVRGRAICNCTNEYSGKYCQEYVHSSNGCVEYCQNDGVCQLNETLSPSCVCVGDWLGPKCTVPAACIGRCGQCRSGSSLNECSCDDGSIRPCDARYDSSYGTIDEATDSSNSFSRVFTLIISILLVLCCIFGVAVYILRKRRIGQPFSHARLTDNVEITNPMYLGEADEQPVFVHEEEKGHFANPVYESMYAGSSDQVLPGGSNSSNMFAAPDEKKCLLTSSKPDQMN